MAPFIQGRTRNCCKCYKPATNWYGWLRKSRDGVVAGWCDEHKPEITAKNKTTYGSHNLFGIYDKCYDDPDYHKTLPKPKPERKPALGLVLSVYDSGDRSVGLFSRQWDVPVPFHKEDADDELLKSFKADIINLYSDFCDGKISAYYDFEKTDLFDLKNDL